MTDSTFPDGALADQSGSPWSRDGKAVLLVFLRGDW